MFNISNALFGLSDKYYFVIKIMSGMRHLPTGTVLYSFTKQYEET